MINSNAYQVWIYDLLNPDERLRVGRNVKIKKTFWVPKPDPREHPTEEEMLKKEREFLLKNGIIF